MQQLGRNVFLRVRHRAQNLEGRVGIAPLDMLTNGRVRPSDIVANADVRDLASLVVEARKSLPHFVDEGVDRDTLCRCERPGTETAQGLDLSLDSRREGRYHFRRTGMTTLQAGGEPEIVPQTHQRIFRVDRGGGPVRLSVPAPPWSVRPPISLTRSAHPNRATDCLLAEIVDHFHVDAGAEVFQFVELFFTFRLRREPLPE
jgi:hypothetical protein